MNIVTTSRLSAVWHVALGVIALASLIMTRIPSLAAYGNVLAVVCASTGTSAVALAYLCLPAWAVSLIKVMTPGLLGVAPTTNVAIEKVEVKP